MWDAETETLGSQLFRTLKDLPSVESQTQAGEHITDTAQWQVLIRMGFFESNCEDRDGKYTRCARLFDVIGESTGSYPLLLSLAAHKLACLTLLRKYACQELQENWLSAIANGKATGAFAVSEIEAGSDIASLKTFATPNPSGYVLNGRKAWVTNGAFADLFLVLAKTNSKHGFLGLGMFAVSKRRTGVTVSANEAIAGYECTGTAELFLDDVQVGIKDRIGGDGGGHNMFQVAMVWERSCLFAGILGIMRRQLRQIIKQAKSRVQFGRAISKNQVVAHQIVEMATKLRMLESLLYRTCKEQDNGKIVVEHLAMNKLVLTEAALQFALNFVHINGAAGTLVGSEAISYLLGAVPSTLYSGSSEMMKDLIASRLGL